MINTNAQAMDTAKQDKLINTIREFVDEQPDSRNIEVYEFLLACGVTHKSIEYHFPLVAQSFDDHMNKMEEKWFEQWQSVEDE